MHRWKRKPAPAPTPTPATPSPPTIDPLAIFARGMVADNVAINGPALWCAKNVYAPADIANLRAMGITYMRIPIDICAIMPGLPLSWATGLSTAAICAASLAYVDTVMATIVAGGLAVMPCPFVAGGPNGSTGTLRNDLGQQPGLYAPYTTLEDLLLQANLVLVNRWKDKYSPAQLGFEIQNEPRYDQLTGYRAYSLWNSTAKTITDAIRAIAPLHTVICGTPTLSKSIAISNMVPTGDANTIYSIHMYDPWELTQQNSGGQYDQFYRYPRTSTPGGEALIGPAPVLNLPSGLIEPVVWNTGTPLTGLNQKVAKLYTIAGTVRETRDYYKAEVTKGYLAALISKATLWAAGKGGNGYTGPPVKILYGEFGSTNTSDRQSRLNWMIDMRDLLDATGVPGGQASIPWEWWAFCGARFGIKPRAPVTSPAGNNCLAASGAYAGWDMNIVNALMYPRPVSITSFC